MFKRDLFLISIVMLSFSANVMAQVEQTEVIRTVDDAKVVFEQRFEATSGLDADAAWEQWSTTVVDTIHQLTYINHVGSEISLKIYTDAAAKWNTTFVKDSLILMRNGVMTTDAAADIKSGFFDADDFKLVYDEGLDQERNESFAQYGENGGKYYFQYTSDNARGSVNYSDGVVPNYRRNLFVRGLNIEDQSSYRLTLYVKAKAKGNTKPTFYADVMRGYFHSEKPFSMGYVDESNTYQYNKTFEYKKDDFEYDQWEKITFMTYYLNDSIADGYFYTAYWWAGGSEWSFRPSDEALAAAGVTLASNDVLKHIKQPDKFFVRLSFASDSTEFSVDNISLTKSWIAGVEHYKDIMRVDFGYETNLKELAKKAEAETGIAAIELGGQYFEVWGYRKKSNSWTRVEINSAEYHDDGYMYMWTKPYTDPNTGRVTPSLFSVYDSVLVSFRNPDDPLLRLNYTGKTFPMALDTTWIKEGKKVHDFNNELSKSNPNVGKGVNSLKYWPPVMQKAPYEEGSFGLEPINEITLGFSRSLEYDNIGETSQLALLKVSKTDVTEVWMVSESNDSTTTFVRSASDIAKNGSLNGDYIFEFLNLKGEGTDYGKNVTMSLGFGEFDHNPETKLPAFVETNWRAENDVQSVPKGITIWDGKTAFAAGKGEGRNISSKSRLYYTDPTQSNGFDCGMYFSSRGESTGGHVFYGYDEDYPLTLSKGAYSLRFNASKWDGYEGCDVTIYVYPRSLTDNPQLSPVDASSKIKLGTFNPVANSKSSKVQVYSDPYGVWDNEEYEYAFAITTDGDYILEFNSAMGASGNAQNYGGAMISNFKIIATPDLSYSYVTRLNKTVNAALEKLEETDYYEHYHGEQFDKLAEIADFYSYENWEDTRPSAYMAAAATVQAEMNKMQLRMDTVDLFYATEEKVSNKLDEFDDENKVIYQDLAAYITLSDHIKANFDWNCSEKTNAELTAEIASYEADIKAIDNRMELISKFEAKVAQIQDSINYSVLKYLDEFDAMECSYEEIMSIVDIINDSNDALIAYYNTLRKCYNNFIFKFEYLEAETRQIKELFNFAVNMGYDFGDKKDEIKSYIDNLQINDSALEAFLREASILQVYKALEANSDMIADGLDVSVLIPNYFMATKAQAGVNMTNRSNGKWAVSSSPNTTVIPEWTIKFSGSYGSIGCCYPGREAMDWEYDGHEFVAGFHFENNTTGSVSTTVKGLPAGTYTASVDMYQNNLSNSKFSFVTDSEFLEFKGSKTTSPMTFSQENVSVPTGSDLTITYTITGATGSGHVDVSGAGLILTAADPTANYRALITNQEEKVASLASELNLGEITPGPIVVEKVHRFYLEDMNCEAGNIVTVPIKMENDDPIVGFQLDVDLPSGMTLVGAYLDSNRRRDHRLTYNVDSWNRVKMLCYSANNRAFYGSDGNILYLDVRVPDDMEGEYYVYFKNMEMTVSAYESYNPDDVYAGKMTVEQHVIPGDVNNDGRVSVTDVVGIVNFIINAETTGLNRRAADVNQDCLIDATDVVSAVNIIIQVYHSPMRSSGERTITSSLSMDDVNTNGSGFSLPVSLNGMQNEITAIQFNMDLPDDIVLNGVNTDNSHIAAYQQQADGSYTVVCVSMSNSTFAGNGDAALSLDLSAGKEFDGGQVVLSNASLVTPDCLKATQEQVVFSLDKNTTGINGIGIDSDSEMFDVLGRVADDTNGIRIQDGQKSIRIK